MISALLFAGLMHLSPCLAFTGSLRALLGIRNPGGESESSKDMSHIQTTVTRLWSRAVPSHPPLASKDILRTPSANHLWVFWACLLLALLLGALWLYKSRYSRALLAGAGVSGLAYAATQPDPRTSRSLLVSTILSYFIFHIVYYCSIITIFGLGDIFFMATVILTVVCFGILSLIPEFASMWIETTGLARLWSIIPLHLVILALLVELIKVARQPIAPNSVDVPLLPVSTRDTYNAESASRTEEGPETRRRVASDDSTVGA